MIMKTKRTGTVAWIVALCTTLMVAAFMVAALSASAEGDHASVTTDGQTAAKFGLLLGDGNGVTDAYLSKHSTRLQAALITLRLQGQLSDALAYKGNSNFSDAGSVSSANQAALAYLNDHPELGWNGTGGGKFNPFEHISSQQLYKVLLEVLGFRTGTDFKYADTESFAASMGLNQIAGNASITNGHIATALVEAVSVKTKNGELLFEQLQAKGVIGASAALPAGERIQFRNDGKLGAFFTDKEGRTLYFFTKDSTDLNSCQGECLKNWPIYYAEELQIPSGLKPSDFGVLERADGSKQTTYKGWPLYYFVKDKAPGDTFGEAAGGVWFVAKSDYAAMLGTSKTLGNYLTDAYGRTLYYFDKDTPGNSACEGGCLANWPAYLAEGGDVPTGVNAADFGTMTRKDGSKQTTYKGYPLYYFIKDSAHGDILGQDVNHVWFVVDPAAFTGTTTPVSKTYHVDIKQYSFGTEPLTVEAGSSIVFTNFDDMAHNAVAVDGSFATPLLAKSESYTIKLDKPGTYDYYCEPHRKFMTGRIIVK